MNTDRRIQTNRRINAVKHRQTDTDRRIQTNKRIHLDKHRQKNTDRQINKYEYRQMDRDRRIQTGKYKHTEADEYRQTNTDRRIQTDEYRRTNTYTERQTAGYSKILIQIPETGSEADSAEDTEVCVFVCVLVSWESCCNTWCLVTLCKPDARYLTAESGWSYLNRARAGSL